MNYGLALYGIDGLRQAEAQAVAAQGGDGFGLMRRAGEAAWRHLLEYWPQAQRIVVVCGPGNNGGDGYVLARHALLSGRDVRVLRLDAHAPHSALCRRASDEYAGAGGQAAVFARALPACDLIVDAMFGIGLSRAPDPDAAALIAAIAHRGAPVLALDVPSGVDTDRGSAPGAAVVATRTLQFIAAHAGLYTGAALDVAGEIAIDDLDVDARAFAGTEPKARLVSREDLRHWLPPRARDSHKGRHGHVLCIGGDEGMGGAIALCAEAALRCGAGLVGVATRAANADALRARRPEAMAHGIASARALEALLERASVVALGPGLGTGEWGAGLYAAAIGDAKPCVIDADALNLLAAEPRALPQAVLTPHPGEAARLLDATTQAVQQDRFAAAEALAKKYDCSVVLKGAGSIVAAPVKTTHVVGAGNPGMASGGMGDVLTGAIAALLAQGLSAFDAAVCGALLHAAAGDEAARDGQRGLLASDLFAHLRKLANP